MVLFSIPDIRLFWSTDERFVNQFKPGQVTKYSSFSKNPPCYKDVSFWLPSRDFEANDLFELIRDVGGTWVEEVKLVSSKKRGLLVESLLICFWCVGSKIDQFEHPVTKRISHCYRISYRSMERYEAVHHFCLLTLNEFLTPW